MGIEEKCKNLLLVQMNLPSVIIIIENLVKVREEKSLLEKQQGDLFLEENDSSGEETKEGSDDLKKIMMDLIAKLDQGEGVDFNSLLSNAAARGHDRDLAEEALDELSAEGSVFEQRFGWFKQTS